jgi:DDE superfamily endonuclease
LRISLSASTIKRILAPFHIRKWQCKKRPELSEEVAKLRYERVLLRKDWSVEEWALIIFSDESSVERGTGGQREWAWRTAQQKWSPQFVQTYSKGHDISIMVWVAIWLGGRSDLVVMTRDEEAKRNGYSANSYINVLDETIERCWQPGITFMQDNAPIHTAKKVSKWFQDRAIPVLDWPSYSPDLNPTEHVWAKMKQWIYENYPQLKEMGASQAVYNQLARVIVEAWEAIPQDYIDGLIRSMDSRVNAAINARGWHTKY